MPLIDIKKQAKKISKRGVGENFEAKKMPRNFLSPCIMREKITVTFQFDENFLKFSRFSRCLFGVKIEILTYMHSKLSNTRDLLKFKNSHNIGNTDQKMKENLKSNKNQEIYLGPPRQKFLPWFPSKSKMLQ
jgi:hypothetical protein